jgi:hypothetical protein
MAVYLFPMSFPLCQCNYCYICPQHCRLSPDGHTVRSYIFSREANMDSRLKRKDKAM